MGQFQHNNIVQLHGVVTEEENMMIVLEYMARGDLQNSLLNLRRKYVSLVPPCHAHAVNNLVVIVSSLKCHMSCSAIADKLHQDWSTYQGSILYTETWLQETYCCLMIMSARC